MPQQQLRISLEYFQTKNYLNLPCSGPVKEFHISRRARDKYQFDQAIFSISGNVIFANFHASRQFAQKINDKRDLINFPERAVQAGQINAMGLIDEILHYVFELYRAEVDPEISRKAWQWLEQKFDRKSLDKMLLKFIDEFPCSPVYQRKIEAEDYLNGHTGRVSNRLILLEELSMLSLANKNPAFSPFLELFDDAELEKLTSYNDVLAELKQFFKTQPGFGPEKQNLIEMLRSPAVADPHSLAGQLKYIADRWGLLLGKYLYQLLGSLDLIKEEEKMRFAFAGEAKVYDFKGMEDEPERFSPDKDWMPRLVLIAKSALVWLDQLSKKYGRSIIRLDQIPDEELDQIAGWGFTGIWLIGVWERSSASKKIKQYCGNPEAESSAYSLFDYIIAVELGGEPALLNLKDRCWKRGIRLASDMVPNHTGIYSKWMIQHPDWYISQDFSPFPVYSFSGANLSDDPRIGIYIDDHYYDRTDAAVAFKHVNFETGDVNYIYHGNDGTSMPWNDTAQLNYLNPEVREAVIQTIIHVARKFSIIRFDAAMTLTKRHFQRLWFPEPGTGGDIPSRVEHNMTKDQFDTLIPVEFWREVVDRIALEVPDTLLLAEAFWLMEGYFVRTLGMHRVYNSAFMNMLNNEENEKYRNVIKKTIEFNPEILKRYVNFMNNPDEETAVAQFGKGDKYFGTCIMLVTMPGLPMFGHGQIEGFTEKYGMEYRRAYWDEQADSDLISRHEKEIFPVMKKRYLFAEVENFRLYDFYIRSGQVNENVFAYSNCFDDQNALVVYNNKYEQTSGWIRTSAAYLERTGSAAGHRLVQKSLGEGLNLKNKNKYFTIFRDFISGLEYIRRSSELCDQGLYLELRAFQYYLFWEFREVEDDESHHYSQLFFYLEGKGVPSIEESLQELFLRPMHHKFTEIFNMNFIHRYFTDKIETKTAESDKTLLSEIENKYLPFLVEVKLFTSSQGDEKPVLNEIVDRFSTGLQLKNLNKNYDFSDVKNSKKALKFLADQISENIFFRGVLFGWLTVHKLGKITGEQDYETYSRSWLDDLLLSKIIEPVLSDLGLDDQKSLEAMALIKILTNHQNWLITEKTIKNPAYQVLNKLLEDFEVQQFLQVNRFKNLLWFNKEAFEELTGWLYVIFIIDCLSDRKLSKHTKVDKIMTAFEIFQILQKGEANSDYQLEKMLRYVKENIGV